MRFSQLNSGNKFNNDYYKRVKIFLDIYVTNFWKLSPDPSRHDRPDFVSHISPLFIKHVNKENYIGKFERTLLQRVRKCVRTHTNIYRVGAMVLAQMLRALSTLRGLRGAPEVPPLCRETQSLGQQIVWYSVLRLCIIYTHRRVGQWLPSQMLAEEVESRSYLRTVGLFRNEYRGPFSVIFSWSTVLGLYFYFLNFMHNQRMQLETE